MNAFEDYSLTSDVRVTNEKLGEGLFSTTYKATFGSLDCAVKKLNPTPELHSQLDNDKLMSNLVERCQLLDSLHHPNITQFLGVTFEKGQPMPLMVSERLYMSLTDCVSQYGTLPVRLRNSILTDVGLGLRYLHLQMPKVVHGCLTSNRILLDVRMTAKIIDIGEKDYLKASLSDQDDRDNSALICSDDVSLAYFPLDKITSSSNNDGVSYTHLRAHETLR